jgi:hypothetical protein
MVVQLSQTGDSIVIPLEVEVYELNTYGYSNPTDRKILKFHNELMWEGKV